MGCGPFRTCKTNSSPEAVAPNPSPSRWIYLDHRQFAGGYALRVRYFDCTNFEGVKVMVYGGTFGWPTRLDPHFTPGADSPIARFRPDEAGWKMAVALAHSL